MPLTPYSTAAVVLAAFAALVLAPDRSRALAAGQFEVRPAAGESADKSVRNGEGKSFGVIVEKDLFRPSRKKPEPPRPKPKPKIEPAAQPKRPPPSVTLTGTVILDTGGVAMLSWQGVLSGSGAYRVGDYIEEFVIVEISSDMVLLKRGDEVLAARMSPGRQPGAGWRPRHRGPARLGPAKDVPPSVLVGGVPYEDPATGEGDFEMEGNGENEWTGQ